MYVLSHSLLIKIYNLLTKINVNELANYYHVNFQMKICFILVFFVRFIYLSLISRYKLDQFIYTAQLASLIAELVQNEI